MGTADGDGTGAGAADGRGEPNSTVLEDDASGSLSRSANGSTGATTITGADGTLVGSGETLEVASDVEYPGDLLGS